MQFHVSLRAKEKLTCRGQDCNPLCVVLINLWTFHAVKNAFCGILEYLQLF